MSHDFLIFQPLPDVRRLRGFRFPLHQLHGMVFFSILFAKCAQSQESRSVRLYRILTAATNRPNHFLSRPTAGAKRWDVPRQCTRLCTTWPS